MGFLKSFFNPMPGSAQGGSIHDPLDIFGYGAKNYNSAEAAKQREFNAAEAQKQRDWEERMSNTAVQRRSEDLEKAGLNRTLAATDGATTGGAAAASGGQASDPGNQAGSVIGAIMQAASMRNQMEQFSKSLAEQKRVNSAQIAKTNAEKARIEQETQNIKDVNPNDAGVVKTIKWGVNTAFNAAPAAKETMERIESKLNKDNAIMLERSRRARNDWELIQKLEKRPKYDWHAHERARKIKQKWGWQ